MITQGLSQHEINLISKILDEHKVQYQVDAAGGADEVKVRGGRGDTSFYQIEIHDGQFNALPASAKARLENYGIYPEMEAPDFSEEPPKEKSPVDVEKNKNTLKTFERIAIIALVAGLGLFIKRVLESN